MFTNTQPVIETLENGLILKSVSTHDEIERLGAFNVAIHQEDILDAMTRGLILEHPNTRPEHWLIVVDPATDQIVSSLCLIPWQWRYEDVTLTSGEMGIVGTHPDYRRRGLIRALDRRFKTLLDEGSYDLSHIQGIPYYYRQFGYEYALPLEGGWQIVPYQIPDDLPDYAQGYTFRAATVEDIPQLQAFYDEMSSSLAIHTVREPAIWRYQIEHREQTCDWHTNWLVSDPHGVCVGYVRTALYGFGTGLIVNEASSLDRGAAVATLHYLKTMASEQEKPYIKLSMADSCPLITVARAWGARSEGRYALQIHIPDPARLLRKIAPVLERRIAQSMFAGFTHTLTLNLFGPAVAIAFENGKIASITTSAAPDGDPENHIPPMLLTPLVLGWRNREELEAIYPDFGAWGLTEPLLDVLFPKMDAFIYQQY